MRNFTLFILLIILSSCKNNTRNSDFEAHCDCYVYNDEIKTENYSFGKVAFIDTDDTNSCAKTQLKDVFLLYYDSICVAVYNQHPKRNIKTIEFFIQKYQSDTTRLSDYIQFDSTIRITLNRLCKDTNDKFYYGKYVWWRDIEYSTLTQPYHLTKNELLQTWYKWRE